MKILIIQPWISYRGSETVSVLQAYYLNKLKHKTKIVCLYVDKKRLPPKGEMVEYILPPNFLSEILIRSKLLFYLFSFPTLLLLVFMNSSEFDILCPHNLPSQWIAVLVAKFKKKKVAWVAHGVPPKAGFAQNSLNKGLWRIGFSAIDRVLVKRVDLIISVSEKVAKEVKNTYGRDSQILYPPVAAHLYVRGKGRKIRRKYDLNGKSLLLLHVSRIHPAKSVELSLRILARLRKKLSGARLIFVGNNDNQAWFEAMLKKYNLVDAVDVLGFVKPDELKDYFAASDLVLAPYWETEGCPAVPLQALVSKRISVVAKGSGVDELISKWKVGLIAEPNDIDFTKKIFEFISNKNKWQVSAKRGREYVIKELSPLAYAKQFVKSI